DRCARALAAGRSPDRADLGAAVMEGAAGRVRAKMMTGVASMAGRLPWPWGHGPGAGVMHRNAWPPIGWLVARTVLTLMVIPALYSLVKGWGLRRLRATAATRERRMAAAE